MSEKFSTVTPEQLVTHVQDTLFRESTDTDNAPAYTLILGAGFSYGVVPTTWQMMREEIGPWFAGNRGHDDLPGDEKKALTRAFWADFNRKNAEKGTRSNGYEIQVRLDAEGLPRDATLAYQTVSKGNALHGINTVDSARDFHGAMALRA